jgi:hypothetical protein
MDKFDETPILRRKGRTYSLVNPTTRKEVMIFKSGEEAKRYCIKNRIGFRVDTTLSYPDESEPFEVE